MKRFAIWIAIGALVLAGLGCSSIAARTKARETKLYPGLRNQSGGTGGDPIFGTLDAVDFALSAGVDTLLLPVDAFYQPKEQPEPAKYTDGTYAGLYRFGRERSDFTRAGSRERWWLTGDIGDVTRRMARPSVDQSAQLRNPVFLVVEGELSESGHYGHLGAYRRQLRVTKVLEVKQMSPDDP